MAKNMQFRCRCHGVSGSCNLKTCWATLPNFQVIGEYLKKKYESSVHLPSAVNVNKLISMMDRNEISAILSSQSSISLNIADRGSPPTIPSPTVSPSTTSTPTTPSTIPNEYPHDTFLQVDPNEEQQAAPEFAPLVATLAPPARVAISGHFISVSSNGNNTSSTPSQINPHERNKQHLPQQQPQQQSQSIGVNQKTSSTTDHHHRRADLLSSGSDSDVPVNLAPMTQQQYQALLKETKLCNNYTSVQLIPQSTTATTTRDLTTRDLNHQKTNHNYASGHVAKHMHRNRLHLHQLNQINGQHLKSATQHLSQLLQSNKDDLIHLHKSPDYCEADLRHGFVGIKSRVCSDNPSEPDSCDKLCCGRGFGLQIYEQTYKCECEFQYCCSVRCRDCEKAIKALVCH